MQTTNPDQMFFKEETDTFNLTVALVDNRMNVTLKDYVDWVIYQKEYTKRDIGQQIHQKMDLNDIQIAFNQTKTKEKKHINKEEKAKKLIKQKVRILHAIKFKREGRLLSIWLQQIKGQINKQLTNLFQVSLKQEIFQMRSSIEKGILFQELREEIKKEKIDKEILQKRVVHLEQENLKIKQQLQGARLEMISKSQEFDRKLHTQKQMLAEEMRIFKEQMRQSLEATINDVTSRNSEKVTEIQKAMASIFTTVRYLSLPQMNINQFQIQGLKMKYIGPNNQFTQFIFNQSIYHTKKFKLKIKIIQTLSRDLMVGLVDYEKQKNHRDSRNSGNAVCYYASNGYKYLTGGNQGGGYLQGDIVELDVDRPNSMVKYLVNAELKATQTHDIIRDSSRVLMPYFEVFNTNDSVEWVID